MEYDPAFPTDEDLDLAAIPLPGHGKKSKKGSKHSSLNIPLPGQTVIDIPPPLPQSFSEPKEPLQVKFNIKSNIKPLANEESGANPESTSIFDVSQEAKVSTRPVLPLPKRAKSFTLPVGRLETKKIESSHFTEAKPDLFLPSKSDEAELSQVLTDNPSVGQLQFQVNKPQLGPIPSLMNLNIRPANPVLASIDSISPMPALPSALNMLHLAHIPQKLRSAQMISQPLVANPAVAQRMQEEAAKGTKERSRHSRSRSKSHRRSRSRKRSTSKSRKRSGSRTKRRSRSRHRSGSRSMHSTKRHSSKSKRRSTSRSRRRSKSPVTKRKRTRSRSISGKRKRSCSPSVKKKRSRSRSVSNKKKRSRSRSVSNKKKRSRSRSVANKKKRSRSRSKSRKRRRSRSRSHSAKRNRDKDRKRSGSPKKRSSNDRKTDKKKRSTSPSKEKNSKDSKSKSSKVSESSSKKTDKKHSSPKVKKTDSSRSPKRNGHNKESATLETIKVEKKYENEIVNDNTDNNSVVATVTEIVEGSISIKSEVLDEQVEEILVKENIKTEMNVEESSVDQNENKAETKSLIDDKIDDLKSSKKEHGGKLLDKSHTKSHVRTSADKDEPTSSRKGETDTRKDKDKTKVDVKDENCKPTDKSKDKSKQCDAAKQSSEIAVTESNLNPENKRKDVKTVSEKTQNNGKTKDDKPSKSSDKEKITDSKSKKEVHVDIKSDKKSKDHDKKSSKSGGDCKSEAHRDSKHRDRSRSRDRDKPSDKKDSRRPQDSSSKESCQEKSSHSKDKHNSGSHKKESGTKDTESTILNDVHATCSVVADNNPSTDVVKSKQLTVNTGTNKSGDVSHVMKKFDEFFNAFAEIAKKISPTETKPSLSKAKTSETKKKKSSKKSSKRRSSSTNRQRSKSPKDNKKKYRQKQRDSSDEKRPIRKVSVSPKQKKQKSSHHKREHRSRSQSKKRRSISSQGYDSSYSRSRSLSKSSYNRHRRSSSIRRYSKEKSLSRRPSDRKRVCSPVSPKKGTRIDSKSRSSKPLNTSSKVSKRPKTPPITPCIFKTKRLYSSSSASSSMSLDSSSHHKIKRQSLNTTLPLKIEPSSTPVGINSSGSVTGLTPIKDEPSYSSIYDGPHSSQSLMNQSSSFQSQPMSNYQQPIYVQNVQSISAIDLHAQWRLFQSAQNKPDTSISYGYTTPVVQEPYYVNPNVPNSSSYLNQPPSINFQTVSAPSYYTNEQLHNYSLSNPPQQTAGSFPSPAMSSNPPPLVSYPPYANTETSGYAQYNSVVVPQAQPQPIVNASYYVDQHQPVAYYNQSTVITSESTWDVHNQAGGYTRLHPMINEAVEKWVDEDEDEDDGELVVGQDEEMEMDSEDGEGGQGSEVEAVLDDEDHPSLNAADLSDHEEESKMNDGASAYARKDEGVQDKEGIVAKEIEPIDPFDRFPDAYRPVYTHLEENEYLVRQTRSSRNKLETTRWTCDCTVPNPDEAARGVTACGPDCINRVLNIECGPRCPAVELCTNRQFQEKAYAPSEPFFAGTGKGWGLRAKHDILPGTFVVEYVGEVVDFREFKRRINAYERAGQPHHYFMALETEMFIDAGAKGNWARFVNHSCEPNAETQKWNVLGKIRIGFFSKELIRTGEEITIDYQFVQYGRQEQKCYCGTPSCNGIMGSSSKQLQDKVRTKDTKGVERRLIRLLGLTSLKKSEDIRLLLQVMVQECLLRDTRLSLLELLCRTTSEECLRLFCQYNGLELIAAYMRDSESLDWNLKKQLLGCLKHLPIAERKELKSGSNVLAIVEQWVVDPRFCRRRPATTTVETPSPREGTSKETSRGSDATGSRRPSSTLSAEFDDGCSDTVDGQEDQPSTIVDMETGEKQEVDSNFKEKEEVRQAALELVQAWNLLPEEIYRIPKMERQETEEALKSDVKTKAQHSVLSGNNATSLSWGIKKKSNGSVSSKAKSSTTAPKMPKAEFRRLFEMYVRMEEEEKDKKKKEAEAIDTLAELTNLDPESQEAMDKIQKLLSERLLKSIEQLKSGVPASETGLPPELYNLAQREDIQKLFDQVKQADPAQLFSILGNHNAEASIQSTPLPGSYSAPTDGLPPNWKWSRSTDGRVYFYHAVTKRTQWETPVYPWDAGENDPEAYNFNRADCAQVGHDEIEVMYKRLKAAFKKKQKMAKLKKRQKRKQKKSCKPENRRKKAFAKEMYGLVINFLKQYKHEDCKTGRITSDVDLKYLAKKLSQTVLIKELKKLAHIDDLEVNLNVRSKAEDYIAKYMSTRGSVYVRHQRGLSHSQADHSADQQEESCGRPPQTPPEDIGDDFEFSP